MQRGLNTEYYTCKEFEDEVNCKGHLTKPPRGSACEDDRVMKQHVLKREQIAGKKDHNIIHSKEERMK